MSSETTTVPEGNVRQPKDSAFKQQALPAWQPILTAGTVLPTFFVIGVAFIPIGVGLMYFSNQVHEVTVDYTTCKNSEEKLCSDVISSSPDTWVDGKPPKCECTLAIDAEKIGDEDWEGRVFLYYGLTNFYQNHRRYVKSRDDKQLLGQLEKVPTTDCDPFLNPAGNESYKYAPCGAIANSMFNDSISLQWREGEEGEWNTVPVLRTGIAWETDKEYKFRNPEGVTNAAQLQKIFEDNKLVKPRDWQKEVWELDVENPTNNGFQNEDLIVWMRTAALPNFRKLYRRVDHDDEQKSENYSQKFKKGLPANFQYQLKIDYAYKVTQFSGTKSVIISTTSLLGGKNPFLGIAYIVVGCVCFIMGVVFLFIHLRFGRTTHEMMNITSRTSYTAN